MKKLILLSSLILVLFPSLCFAFDVTLAWDPSSSQDIKEYVVHYDTVSGSPKSNSMVAGDLLEFVVPNLVEGTLYYFHVTAKDWEGRESGPSNEVRTDGIVTPDSGEDPMAPGGCYVKTIES